MLLLYPYHLNLHYLFYNFHISQILNLYLSSLKNFKLNKSNYASNFNYVDIKSKKIENIYNELIEKNFDEVWFYNGKTFDNIVNLIFQSDEEALSNLTSVLGLKNIVSKGLIFDVVAF